MNCRLEKSYHTVLFIPPLGPYHHCEIYLFKFERDLNKPPGDPVWDCWQSDPVCHGSLEMALTEWRDLFHQWVFWSEALQWQELCCVVEDHPDCGSAQSQQFRPMLLPVAVHSEFTYHTHLKASLNLQILLCPVICVNTSATAPSLQHQAASKNCWGRAHKAIWVHVVPSQPCFRMPHL